MPVVKKSIVILLVFIGIHVNAQQTIFLVGDAGLLNNSSTSVFLSLEQQLNKNDSASVIILGDNCYSKGLVEEKDQKVVKNQLSRIASANGLKIVLPGNHDWHDAQKKGLKTVKQQESFVESFGDSTVLFSPDAGQPGPEWFELSKEVLLVVFDSQWWVHKYEKDTSCFNCSEVEFLETMDSLISASKDKQIVIAAHHPLFSLGHHGGHYSFKDHMKPFPVIGSLVILSKWIFPGRQEINNRQFRRLKDPLVELLNKCSGLIYVSGHDHSLQVLKRKNINYLISGSASKSTFVKKAKNGEYSHHGYGYMELKIGDTNSVIVRNEKGEEIKVIEF